MKCPVCEHDLLATALSIGDLAVCPECGEISVVSCLVPLSYRRATPNEWAELSESEDGYKILMYSELLRAQRKGLSADPGSC